jgi:hypothetical protein
MNKTYSVVSSKIKIILMQLTHKVESTALLYLQKHTSQSRYVIG